MKLCFTKICIRIETTRTILSSLLDILTKVTIVFTLILDVLNFGRADFLRLCFESMNW